MTLAVTIGQDGQTLLGALDHPDTPDYLRHMPSVTLLRNVWQQQYDHKGGQIPWKGETSLPLSAERVSSPYDPEARAGNKRSRKWLGSTVHLTETCDDDRPRFLTNVETVPATTTDVEVTATIHEALAQADLPPQEHLVDAGSMSAKHLVAGQKKGMNLIGPVAENTNWQAKIDGGSTTECFTSDWEEKGATCPEGETSVKWRETEDDVWITFPAKTCQACPARERWTTSARGRGIHVHPQARYDALIARRSEQELETFQKTSQQRAGSEGTIAHGVRGFGLRRCRYIGLAKTRLQHVIIAVAITLVRLMTWLRTLFDAPPAIRRPSAFAEVAIM